jgi:amidase
MSVGRSGPLVAVKDLIDVAGTPTTAGCRAVAERAVAAEVDAACLAGLRAAIDAGAARLAGKAGLHELAFGVSGINPWFGTPRNPLGPDLVPGGSSSGSASAVGFGEADIGIGTDTGGSVRIPAACCGVVGLKTTAGRIPCDGVWPLAPSLDTVGPLARDVAGVVAGMVLLDPAFDATSAAQEWPGGRIGRVRPDLPVDPAVDAAVDAALTALVEVGRGSVAVVELAGTGDRVSAGWSDAVRTGLDILGAEAAALHRRLATDHPDGVGADVAASLAHAAGIGHQRLRDARAASTRWSATLATAFSSVDVLALPTIGSAPPTFEEAARWPAVRWTLPVNVAGLPALAVPVRRAEGPPASVQLVGPPGGEELLCRIGAAVEASAGLG